MVFDTAALIVLGLGVFLIAECLAEDVPVFGEAHDRTTFFLEGFFVGRFLGVAEADLGLLLAALFLVFDLALRAGFGLLALVTGTFSITSF